MRFDIDTMSHGKNREMLKMLESLDPWALKTGETERTRPPPVAQPGGVRGVS